MRAESEQRMYRLNCARLKMIMVSHFAFCCNVASIGSNNGPQYSRRKREDETVEVKVWCGKCRTRMGGGNRYTTTAACIE